MEALGDKWDGEAFVKLLAQLVGENKQLQNGAVATPVEDRGAHV